MNFSENNVFAFGSLKQKSAIFDATMKNLSISSDNEKFLSLLDLRVYFFSDATNQQKSVYINSIIDCMSKDNTFLASYTELLGVLYKYVNTDWQNTIADTIIALSAKITSTIRGIVSLLNFYKNAHRLFDDEKENKFTTLIEIISKSAPPQLDETFMYASQNRLRTFPPHVDSEVLFVIPEFLSGMSFLQMPISLMTAMEQTEKAGLNCDILDNRVFGYSIEQVAAFSQKYQFVVVCSSTVDQVQNYFLDYRYDVFRLTVRSIKNLGATIIVCGAHGSVKPQLVMKDVPADYLISGEFDFQIADLLRSLRTEQGVANLPNIYYRKDGELKFTYKDENKLHPIEWSNVAVPYDRVRHSDYFGYNFFENTHVKKMNWGILQASRGCPYKCAFCYDFYEKRVRFKRREIVIEEITKLLDSGVSEVFFIDQTFTLNREYTINLCKAIIDAGIKFSWRCETRVDLVDEELLAFMKKAGCNQIWLGVESLDESVLQKNDKNYGIDTLEKSVALIEAAGISYCVFIMLGMVGDTSETVRKTVNEIIGRNIHTTRSIITFTPRFGTAVMTELSICENPENLDFHALYYLKGSIANTISSADLADSLSRLLQYVSK